MRSIFIPLERVDRFDVVWEYVESHEFPGDQVERLVLLTRDGKKIYVQPRVIEWLSKWRGMPLQIRAQQLNNHILPTWRAARPADGDQPPARS